MTAIRSNAGPQLCPLNDHDAYVSTSAAHAAAVLAGTGIVALQWHNAIHALGMLHAASEVANPMAGFHKI
jgi:hypothetical protein